MNTQTGTHHPSSNLWAATLALCLAGSGCGRNAGQPMNHEIMKDAGVAGPLAWVLAPHDGEGRLDSDIRQCQARVRAGTNPEAALERLGWLFVAKARESFDPGYYKLAEQCALRIESSHPRSPEGLLLRGHVLQNLHRFKEAEPIARELVAGRGRAFDFGLLGDLLLEQGRLTEAIEAYQKMADLKPDLHAHARAAHVRWLKGDLAGAIEAIQEAVQSASPHDAESAAWVNSRLALYQFQAGDFIHAAQSIEA